MLSGERIHVNRVAPGIEQLRLSTRLNRFMGFASCCYLVDDVLLDCASARVRGPLLAYLDKRPPRDVYLTHHHEDHAGNSRTLQARFGCRIFLRAAHLCEGDRVGDPPIYRRRLWGAAQPYSATEMPDEVVTSVRRLRVMDAKGHAATQVAFYDAEEGALFCGDLLISRGASEIAANEDPYEIVRSLRRAAALEPRLLLGGHGLILEAPTPTLLKKADRIEEAIGRVQELAREGAPTSVIINTALRGGSAKDRCMAWLTQDDFSKANLVRAILRGPREAAHN